MVMVSRGGWLVAFSRGERGRRNGWRMEGFVRRWLAAVIIETKMITPTQHAL